jgi:hypothetical protein
VSGGVHERLTFVDQREVQIADYFAFAGTQRLPEQFALRCDDRGEAASRDRSRRAARVRHDLPLLIGIEPSGRANHENARLERVIAYLDFGLSSEQVAEDRSRKHRGMDLLAIGD